MSTTDGTTPVNPEPNQETAPTAAAPVGQPSPPPKNSELKPILASWLKDREEFIDTVKDTSYRASYEVIFHTVRSWLYALRLVCYAPRGIWRFTKLITAAIAHVETRQLRTHAAWHTDTKEGARVYLALKKDRDATVSRRLVALGILSVLTTVGLLGLWHLAPRWEITTWWVLTRGWLFGILGGVTVGVFGYVGRPLGQPLVAQATLPNGDPKLTNDIVLEALCSLGIPKMTDPAQIQLLYGVKPSRAGYHIDLTLPRGVAATEVMAKRPKLSSALQRGIGTVWPSVGPRHEGHLQLFVSHEDMSKATQRPWPLLKQGSVNVFKPTPMFTDQKGDWVELTLATTCGLIGAVPRMGKTYFQRELGLVGSLDPRTEEYVFELKGTGDLSCLKMVAHYYSDSDEPDDIAEHLSVMRTLQEERRRRSRVVKSLPNEVCPRSEVTDELASRKDLRLHPILILVDECQTWFLDQSDKTVRDEFERIADELVRKGPAVGIMAYFSSQELGKDSIPSTVSRNASVRVCFKVNDANANNKVLGNGAYASGYQATMFDFYKDKGIAYLKAEGPPQIVRTVAAMDKVEADKVALRARAARQAAGRLTGYAAGEDMDDEVDEVILLDDARRVVGAADAMHLTDMAAGLAVLRPALYGSLDAAALGSLLRGAGVRVDSVYVSGKPRPLASNKGVKREWLAVATTRVTGPHDPQSVGNVRRLRP